MPQGGRRSYNDHTILFSLLPEETRKELRTCDLILQSPDAVSSSGRKVWMGAHSRVLPRTPVDDVIEKHGSRIPGQGYIDPWTVVDKLPFLNSSIYPLLTKTVGFICSSFFHCSKIPDLNIKARRSLPLSLQLSRPLIHTFVSSRLTACGKASIETRRRDSRVHRSHDGRCKVLP